MEWQLVTGIAIIAAGVVILGTQLGTRGKSAPIIAGIAVIMFGAYFVFDSKTVVEILMILVRMLR